MGEDRQEKDSPERDETQRTSESDGRWSNRRIILLTVAIALVFYMVFRLPETLTQVMGRAQETLVLVILSIGLAYFLLPAVDLLCKIPVNLDSKIKRSIAALLAIVIFLVLLISLATLIVTPIVAEVGQLLDSLTTWAQEDLAETLEGYVEAILARLPEQIRERVEAQIEALDEDWTGERITEMVSERMEQLGQALVVWPVALVTGLLSTVRYIVGLIMMTVFAYYFLTDAGSIRRGIEVHVPGDFRKRYHQTIDDMDAVIQGYVHTLLLVSLIIGVATILILYFGGVQAYLTFGILAGIANMVPVLGAIVTVIAMSAIALLQVGFYRALLIMAIYGAVEVVVDRVVAPKLMSGGSKLHPIVIILAILIGAEFFGFIGLFIAVPLVATVRVVWMHYRAHMSDGEARDEFDGMLGRGKKREPDDPSPDAGPDSAPKSVVDEE